MGFIQRELALLECALRTPQAPDVYAQLYAAQQALAWAMEPGGFASPAVMIARDGGNATDTQGDAAGYSLPLGPPSS